jgi:hypothetical protein
VEFVPPVPVYETILTPLKSNRDRTLSVSRINLKSRASMVPVTVRFVTIALSVAVNEEDNLPPAVTFTVLDTCALSRPTVRHIQIKK